MQRAFFLLLFIFYLFAGCNFSAESNVVWKFKTKYKSTSAPVVAGQNVYVGNDKLYCINAKTGKLVWEFDTFTSDPSEVLVVDGHVYFQCGGLYCLDAVSGKVVWEFWKKEWLDEKPVIAGGHIYTLIKGRIYCLNAKNGKKIWAVKAPAAGSKRPILAASDDHVYGSSDETIYCLNAENGRTLWKVNLKDRKVKDRVFSLFASKDKLYVFNGSKEMVCINGASGKIVWVSKDSLGMGPFVSDNYVYYYAGNIFCLNASSGNHIWKSNVISSSRNLSNFVMGAGDILYVHGSGHRMYCLDIKTGEKLQEYKVPPGLFAVENKHIYVNSDHYVCCVKIPEG